MSEQTISLVWDVVKWLIMAAGSIIVGWATMRRDHIQMQVTISTQGEKITAQEKKIAALEEAANSNKMEVADRLARLETEVARLPRMEAKLDMLVTRKE